MRAGFNGGWIEEDGKTIGLSLGSDFTSEHEWGIGKLKRLLGIDGITKEYSREKPVYTKPHGLPRRIITKHDAVKLYSCRDEAALLCVGPWMHERFQEHIDKLGKFREGLPGDLRGSQGELRTAWSESDFGIYGIGKDAELIKELASAFDTNNIAVWIGGSAMVFDNGGLIVCIADRVPIRALELLQKADLDSEKLRSASEATGIIKRLDSAGRKYFACSPKWISLEMSKKSVHPVIYWLNPQEQRQNNFGWFTVEELDQWIASEGPIPMKVKAEA